MWLRAEAGSGPAAWTVPVVEIRLSTTVRPPDGLSPFFSVNVGLDEQLVHDGPLELATGAAGPPGGPLAFDGGDVSHHDIWRMRLDGTVQEKLTAGQLYHLDLALAEGPRLAFSSNRSGDYEIWTWSLGLGEPPVQRTARPGLDGRPTWGPGARNLIYHSVRNGIPNLWRMRADGADAVQLTHHAQGARGPVWWPVPAGR